MAGDSSVGMLIMVAGLLVVVEVVVNALEMCIVIALLATGCVDYRLLRKDLQPKWLTNDLASYNW